MTTGSGVGLDWRDGKHFNRGNRAPCRHCGKPTFLLDDDGLPSHKVCAEAVAAR